MSLKRKGKRYEYENILEVAQDMLAVPAPGSPEGKCLKKRNNVTKEAAFTCTKPFPHHLHLLHTLLH